MPDAYFWLVDFALFLWISKHLYLLAGSVLNVIKVVYYSQDCTLFPATWGAFLYVYVISSMFFGTEGLPFGYTFAAEPHPLPQYLANTLMQHVRMTIDALHGKDGKNNVQYSTHQVTGTPNITH